MHPASRDGRAEPPVGQIGLGDDHEARRIPVQPMDDSRPAFRPTGQGRPPCDKRVDQGVIPMARRRMNHETGGLVDDGQVLVFEHEREGNGSRLERSRRFVVRYSDDDDLAASEEAGSASDFSVDRHPLVGHQSGGLGAGDGHLIGEKPVEPFGFQAENCEFDFVRGILRGHRVGLALPRCPAVPPSRLHLRQPESTPPPIGGRPPATARWRVRWHRS